MELSLATNEALQIRCVWRLSSALPVKWNKINLRCSAFHAQNKFGSEWWTLTTLYKRTKQTRSRSSKSQHVWRTPECCFVFSSVGWKLVVHKLLCGVSYPLHILQFFISAVTYSYGLLLQTIVSDINQCMHSMKNDVGGSKEAMKANIAFEKGEQMQVGLRFVSENVKYLMPSVLQRENLHVALTKQPDQHVSFGPLWEVSMRDYWIQTVRLKHYANFPGSAEGWIH